MITNIWLWTEGRTAIMLNTDRSVYWSSLPSLRKFFYEIQFIKMLLAHEVRSIHPFHCPLHSTHVFKRTLLDAIPTDQVWYILNQDWKEVHKNCGRSLMEFCSYISGRHHIFATNSNLFKYEEVVTAVLYL